MVRIGDAIAGFVSKLLVDFHLAGQNGTLRFFARRAKASFDQGNIQPFHPVNVGDSGGQGQQGKSVAISAPHGHSEATAYQRLQD